MFLKKVWDGKLKKEKMLKSYFSNYLKAIDNPLPELKETFSAEIEILKKLCNLNSVILDVGSGAGRPAKDLAQYVRKIIAIDNDDLMLEEAQLRCKGIKNLEIKKENAFNMSFQDNFFDLVYATYNLIGSINQNERQSLVNEMKRAANIGGLIINFTWRNDKFTTDFLKKYYPSIGIHIVEIDDNKTATSIGEFTRISKQELEDYYTNADIKNLKIIDVGSVWTAIIGEKNNSNFV